MERILDARPIQTEDREKTPPPQTAGEGNMGVIGLFCVLLILAFLCHYFSRWEVGLQKRLVCFVVINPCVLSANIFDLGFFFCVNNSQILPPPPQPPQCHPSKPCDTSLNSGKPTPPLWTWHPPSIWSSTRYGEFC